MIKMVGVVQQRGLNLRGEVKQLGFLDFLDNSNYKVARNLNWDKLKNLDGEVIEAWGRTYYEYVESIGGRSKVFYIKKFIIKRDDIFNEILIGNGASLPSIFNKRNSWIE